MISLEQLEALNLIKTAAAFAAASKLGTEDVSEEDRPGCEARLLHNVNELIVQVRAAVELGVDHKQAALIAAQAAEAEYDRLARDLERMGLRKRKDRNPQSRTSLANRIAEEAERHG